MKTILLILLNLFFIAQADKFLIEYQSACKLVSLIKPTY